MHLLILFISQILSGVRSQESERFETCQQCTTPCLRLCRVRGVSKSFACKSTLYQGILLVPNSNELPPSHSHVQGCLQCLFRARGTHCYLGWF